jgi:hypothetical protein
MILKKSPSKPVKKIQKSKCQFRDVSKGKKSGSLRGAAPLSFWDCFNPKNDAAAFFARRAKTKVLFRSAKQSKFFFAFGASPKEKKRVEAEDLSPTLTSKKSVIEEESEKTTSRGTRDGVSRKMSEPQIV